MLALFGIAGVGVLYITGGIGDGVDLFGNVITDGDDTNDTPSETASPADLFDDDDGSDSESDIDTAVQAGALAGCGEEGDRTFCPNEPITRADFAVALDAALDPPEAENSFQDVSADAPYAGAVARLSADGVISGCGDARFCPDDPVTREQAAALVSRTLDLSGQGVQEFDDVPQGSTFAQVIGQMTSAGIMQECVDVPPQFCPGDPLLRADAASLLVEAGLVG